MWIGVTVLLLERKYLRGWPHTGFNGIVSVLDANFRSVVGRLIMGCIYGMQTFSPKPLEAFARQRDPRFSVFSREYQNTGSGYS